MKLVKNPIEVNAQSWDVEAITEISECLVLANYVISLQAVRFAEPAPDHLFYMVTMQPLENEVCLLSEFDHQDYGPVSDEACFATLHDALKCLEDTIYSLAVDLPL